MAGQDVVVPDLRGNSEDEAVERLGAADLVPDKLGEDRSDGPPIGSILRTRPAAGAVVAAGATVGYIIASALWPAPEATGVSAQLTGEVGDLPAIRAET